MAELQPALSSTGHRECPPRLLPSYAASAYSSIYTSVLMSIYPSGLPAQVTWALGPPPTPPHERAAAHRAMARVQDFGSCTNPQGMVSQKHRISQCLPKSKVKSRANDFGVLICILLPRPPFFCRGKAQTVKQYRGFKARRPLALAGHFSQGNPHFKSSLKTKLQFIYKHVWTRQAP